MSIREAFLPIRRTTRTPAKLKRIAIRLSYKMDVRDVAYLFRVQPKTIYAWRYRTRL